VILGNLFFIALLYNFNTTEEGISTKINIISKNISISKEINIISKTIIFRKEKQLMFLNKIYNIKE
jgi:hypothetical protein